MPAILLLCIYSIPPQMRRDPAKFASSLAYLMIVQKCALSIENALEYALA